MGWRVVVVKFPIVRNVEPHAMNSSFQSLGHLRVEFGIDGMGFYLSLVCANSKINISKENQV